MKSPAARHFPPVVFRNGERCLWNSIRRKPLVNRPEERVRLRYLDFLLLEAGWPRTRIAIESVVSPAGKGSQLRVDLVCLSEKMTPSVLIECKAGSIKPGEPAAVQIARYNRSVGAEYLCITNGREDHWFRIMQGKALPLQHPPFATSEGIFSGTGAVNGDNSPAEPQFFGIHPGETTVTGSLEPVTSSAGRGRNFKSARSVPGYWQQRGFLGRASAQSLLEILTVLLPDFWNSGSEDKSSWLSFQISYRDVPLDHYYRLFDREESGRLAVTFTGSPGGETWLVAFLNEEQSAKGYIVINLDRLFSGNSPNAELMIKGRTVSFGAGVYLNFDNFRGGKVFIDEMVLKLYDMFKKETER